jgi:hypothetical protein
MGFLLITRSSESKSGSSETIFLNIKLARESIQRFGNAWAISRVIDAMVKENKDAKKQAKKDIVKLLHSKKVEKVSQKELERERHELSIGFENRGL